MPPELASPDVMPLAAAAAALGVGHTLLGPDHYVPFAALSRAGDWSAAKTLVVTAACGVAHVAGSVAIGGAGLALGVAVGRLEGLEAVRGQLAGWLLTGLGLACLVWALARSRRAATPSASAGAAASGGDGPGTPSLLFAVFALGPCEPLIPLLLVPAALAGPTAVAVVAVVFVVATVVTMIAAVFAIRTGLGLVPLLPSAAGAQAWAGAAVVACGLLVVLGL